MTSGQRTPPTRATVNQLLKRPFDRNAWDAAVAQDLHVRIGNAPPAVGKEAALAELDRFFARIMSVGESYRETYKFRETVFCEVEVDFRDETGEPRRIPCVIVVRAAGTTLLDVRFHLDPSPIP